MRKWNKCRKCGCFLDPGEGSICDDCRRAQEKVKIVPTIQEHGGQYRLFLKPDKKNKDLSMGLENRGFTQYQKSCKEIIPSKELDVQVKYEKRNNY